MVVSGGMTKKKHFLLDSSNWYPAVSFLAFYWGLSWACAEFLSQPWDVIVVVATGMVVSTIRQGVYDREKPIPTVALGWKTNLILGLIYAAITAFFIWFAVYTYTDQRPLGLTMSFLAAEIFASFLNFVRQASSQKTPVEDRPVDPPQAPGRPAPIYPKLPTLDASGTLTLPREE